jgi:hypothetical protein
MNIFQKNCPECASPNPAEAMSCRCGYDFDPEALADADPSEYAQQQDRLYRDYLAARVAQAEAELTVAREQANADPESTYRASNALLAEQSLNALKAEFKQLSLRVSAMAPARRAVPARRPISQPNRTGTAKTPIPHAVTRVTPKPAAPRTPTATAWKSAVKASPQRLPAPMERRKLPAPPIAAPSKPKAFPAMRAAPARPPVAQGNSRPSTPPVATAPSRQPSIPNRPVSPPVNGKNRQTAPTMTNRPDQRFRQVQTQKAEAIARSKPGAATALARTNGKTAPQRASADIPPLVLSKKKSTQECPNCTASVAADSPRCGCGYMLARPGDEVPALTLDATALAILTEGISFNSSNRRR